MSAPSTSELPVAPAIHPLVRWISRAWLLPRRTWLKRFRLGRRVTERIAGLSLEVLPEVFNPVVFRTGAYFAGVLTDAELPGGEPAGEPQALDVGTGSGILALVLARRGFRVSAVDLNPAAVRCARENAERNGLSGRVEVLHGDLFAPLPDRKFDVVTFSPPSFRGEPTSDFDLCWRAVDIFERFADGLPAHLRPGGCALVLQTSHGDEEGLLAALAGAGFTIDVFARRHFGVEYLTVYRVRQE